MDWFQAMYLGAAGGGLVQLIAFYVSLGNWQEARRQRRQGDEDVLPSLNRFVDFPVDGSLTATRVLLGGIAGWVFHGQIVGEAAAIAVGASAPALLQQLGKIRSVREEVQYGNNKNIGEEERYATR